MNISKFLFLGLLALGVVSCRQKSGPGTAEGRIPSLDSTDHLRIEQVRALHITKEHVFEHDYDSLGVVGDSTNTQISYTVLDNGQVRRTRSIEHHWATNLDTTVYDLYNRPIHTANIDGYSWTTTIYDDEHHIVVDSLNVGGRLRIKLMTFDPAGRLLSINGGPDGLNIHRAYDDRGALTSEVDSSHGKLTATKMVTLDASGRDLRSLETLFMGASKPNGGPIPMESLVLTYHDPVHHQRFDTLLTKSESGAWTMQNGAIYFRDSAANIEEIRRPEAPDHKLIRYVYDKHHTILRVETENGVELEATETLDANGLVMLREEYGPGHKLVKKIEHTYVLEAPRK